MKLVGNCPFCQIVSGLNPAEKLVDWGDVITFQPLNPVTPGHTLVVPKDHVDDAVASPVVTAETMRIAAMHALRYGVSANIITSIGEAATQSVFHLHVHVVPRREGDGLKLPWSEDA